MFIIAALLDTGTHLEVNLDLMYRAGYGIAIETHFDPPLFSRYESPTSNTKLMIGTQLY